jgi:hydroxymethylpyrimidine pyrophosphatase-like HAD family hydrolase
MLGITSRDVVAFGDGNDDVELLEWAGLRRYAPRTGTRPETRQADQSAWITGKRVRSSCSFTALTTLEWELS